VYPDLSVKYMDFDYLKEWDVLTPTNDIADMINTDMVFLIPEDEKL
jgi:hypothetical protein